MIEFDWNSSNVLRSNENRWSVFELLKWRKAWEQIPERAKKIFASIFAQASWNGSRCSSWNRGPRNPIKDLASCSNRTNSCCGRPLDLDIGDAATAAGRGTNLLLSHCLVKTSVDTQRRTTRPFSDFVCQKQERRGSVASQWENKLRHGQSRDV